jgi:3-phosphoglycerate kinase
MIIGGKKPKFEAIPNLVDKMDILTAGVPGILTAKLSGHEIGPRNEELLADVFKGMDKEIKLYGDLVEDYCIGYPVDFTLSQQGNFSDSNRFNVQLKDLSKPEWETYEIYDIGKETVKSYAEMINTGRYD